MIDTIETASMDEKQSNMSIKAVILGASGVGKTSMVDRWVTGLWNPAVTQTVSVWHQKKTVDVDGDKVDVYLWDTAGQEKFQALVPLYARSASVAILVASAEEPSTFENLKNSIEVLDNSCEVKPPCVLAINKVDLLEDSNRYCLDDIEQTYGIRFVKLFYCSAMTGEGIEETFLEATAEGYKFFSRGREKPVTTANISKKEQEDKDCC